MKLPKILLERDEEEESKENQMIEPLIKIEVRKRRTEEEEEIRDQVVKKLKVGALIADYSSEESESEENNEDGQESN